MCGGGHGFHLFPFFNNDSQNYQETKYTGYRIPKGICLKIGSHQLFLYFQILIPLLLNPMEVIVDLFHVNVDQITLVRLVLV